MATITVDDEQGGVLLDALDGLLMQLAMDCASLRKGSRGWERSTAKTRVVVDLLNQIEDQVRGAAA